MIQFTKFTIDTFVSELRMLEVHVAQVGFEVDRIVISAIQM